MLTAKIYTTPVNASAFDAEIILVAEYELDSVNIKRSIREFSSFSFDLYPKYMNTDQALSGIAAPILVKIERDSEYIIEGILAKVSYKKDSVTIECEDILFNLSFYAPANRAWYLYRNCQVAALFRYFLNNGTPFTPSIWGRLFDLGNFFTADVDLVKSINFDSRESNVLSDLFFRLSDSMRNFYYQLGTYDIKYFSDAADPAYRINIGAFDTDRRFEYNTNNITDIQLERSQTPYLHGLYPFGDTYEQPAGTQNVLSVTSGAVTNYDAAFVLDLTNEGVSWNFFAPGNVYRKTENIYPDVAVHTKITPGAAMRGEASESLYSIAVNRLRSDFDEDGIQVSSNVFPFHLRPGNIIKINYEFKYLYYNVITNQLETRTLSESSQNILEGNYYIQDYDLTVYQNDLDVNLTLKSEQAFDNQNPIKLTRKQLKKIKKNKEYFVGRNALDVDVAGFYTVTVGSGLASNTTLGGNPARSTVVSKLGAANFGGASSIPVGATPVTAYYICTDPAYEDRVNLDFSVVPAAGVANFTIVTQFDDNWTVNDEVVVKILVFFNV